MFAFNGDLFLRNYTLGEKSDTEWLFERLSEAETEDEIIRWLTSVEGPFSLVFYSQRLRRVYFCRDFLGRNSLLVAVKERFNYVVASVLGKLLFWADQTFLVRLWDCAL